MDCLIMQTLRKAAQKQKQSEVVARYLRLKYRINVSLNALKNRWKLLGKSSNDAPIAAKV